MKRITLLFLALSSLTLAGVTTTTGPNPTSTPNTEDTGATAGINVNVSATVTGETPELIITDASGTPISAVNFNHELEAGEVTNQGEQTLTANLRVKGSALSEANYLDKLVPTLGVDSLTLTNGVTGNTLTSALTTSKNGFDNNGAVLNVTSALAGTAIVGNYAAQTTTLTVTYNKTTTGQ